MFLQDAAWKGQPLPLEPHWPLHISISPWFLPSCFKLRVGCREWPCLQQAVSVLGCNSIPGPGTGERQQSHRSWGSILEPKDPVPGTYP